MNQRPSPGNGRGLDRLPPQAVEVEQAVLGAMLLDGRAVGRAIELLDAEAFYHGPHARIYSAMLSLYERNEAVDQLTVGEELKRRAQLDECGGVVYLAELAAGVASAANIEHHAKIVIDRGLSRNLIEASAEIANRAFEGRSDVHELIDWAEQRIFALSEKRLSRGFEPIETVLHETFEHIERAHNRSSAVSGVDTGFTDLNDITSGFQPGDLVVLAARPSVGKTALSLSFASNTAVDHGTGVAVFSLEMSKQQVAQRLLCIETRVDLHKLRTGRLSEQDWIHLTQRVGRLAQAPIYIDDTPGLTVLEARAKARRLQRERGIGMVVVDYLQLMGTHEQTQSREQEVSRISRGLKALAKELDVPVLALSQLSRAPEARTDRRPQLSDLRESGCLTGDTLVATADGRGRVPIREVLSGTLVWALDEASGWIVPTQVARAFCTGTKSVCRLTTRLGRTLRATGNHRLLTMAGWRRLDELHPGQHIALPRSIPEVFRQPADGIASFLRHLWATDGAIRVTPSRRGGMIPPIYYASSSARLAGDVQSLLLRLTINARVKVVPQPGKGRDQHHVVLSGAPCLRSFAEHVGTVGTYRTNLSRGRAMRVAGVVGSDQLLRLAQSDIYWDEVASVAPEGEEEVFDLTIPEHHNFVADDIVVHNSIEQDADVVMFIYRPELYKLKSADGASQEGIAEIIIGKQRNGPTGSVHLMWNKESASFENLAPDFRVQQEEEEFP